MTKASAVAEIIATYQKYGWILRRVLLTSQSSKNLQHDKDSLFGETIIVDSAIDAAWFSRPPKSGGVAWEIRYLGDIPFALLENVDEDDEQFENLLSSVELRLCESISAKISA
ncbi:MAG: hypothetical protein IPL32_11625 [Chloracidobacterium sp.]|nr:hypothetical protein [Chloracidobacterium sp.]